MLQSEKLVFNPVYFDEDAEILRWLVLSELLLFRGFLEVLNRLLVVSDARVVGH